MTTRDALSDGHLQTRPSGNLSAALRHDTVRQRREAGGPELVGCLAAFLLALVLGVLTQPSGAVAATNDPAFADRIAAELGVKPGATVAEIGAGRGEMTVLMAPKVGPAGRMYANEIEPERLAEIRQRVANASIGNVTVVTATATDTGLPADSCDAIYMIYVYHHLTDPTAYDSSIFRALRPGGALFIADFYPTWLLGGMGVPQPQLVEQLTTAGFQTVHVLTNCPPSRVFMQYCVLFRKPAATNPGSPTVH